MAEPYQNRYGNNTQYPYPQQQQQQQQYQQYPPQTPIDQRPPSFETEYYDGGSGVARRPSIQTTHLTNDQFYDSYYNSPPPQPGRGSQQQQQYYSGNTQYPPSYDNSSGGYGGSPVSGGGYGGVSAAPPAPGNHAPYNPAAFPQRHNTTAGMSLNTFVASDQRPQRHASTATPLSPTTDRYNPNAYGFNTPYPAAGGNSRLQMPGGPQSSQQQLAAGPMSPGFPPYQQQGGQPRPGPGRTQFANVHAASYSGGAPYSPGLPPPPPPPSQSVPAQNSYQPPPPPPPPMVPQSPGFYPPQSYGSMLPPTTSAGQNPAYLTRPETHYNSGTESDISAPGPQDEDYGRHPLPSPPIRGYEQGYANQQPLPSPPPPAPPSHGGGVRAERPLPQLPVEAQQKPPQAGLFEDDVEDDYRPNGRAGANGNRGTLGSVYDYYSNSSDMEAAAGLEQMRLDEQHEVEQQKRGSTSQSHAPEMTRQDSEPVADGYDMSSYGGGFADVGFYGGGFEPDPFYPPASTSEQQRRSNSVVGGQPLPMIPPAGTAPGQFGIPDLNSLHPFPVMTTKARVDTWGTGGLADPKLASQQRRMSFEEGGENIDTTIPYPTGARDDSEDDEFPELFYYPPETTDTLPPLSNRPLPDLPGGYGSGESYIPMLTGQGALPYPEAKAGHQTLGLSLNTQSNIPRASSMHNPSASTSAAHTPVRSKTDGRLHAKSNRTSTVGPLVDSEIPVGLAPSDLPTIPLSRKFDPKKLSSRDFRRCREPWALSSIATWLKEMTDGEQDLKEAPVADAVTALFTHYVPTMNIADAETLAAKVVGGFLKEKKLVKEEEWIKFGDGEVGGVIYQITGSGCYSSKLHDIDTPGRCYSHHCARTLKKIYPSGVGADLGKQQQKQGWAEFWNLKKEDVVEANKKEIERQNNLHEIVQTEEEYLEHLAILKTVYRDQILHANPSVIKPTRVESFVRDVFGHAEGVRKVSEEHLLPHLKFRQREQGPWIVGFSDIFREWIRKAKASYLEYAHNFPRADMLVRRETERNMMFAEFLERCRQDPRTRRLDWVTFLKGPITRLQRYSLLLSTVLKHTTVESDEKENLKVAIEEIKAVTLECDARVDEMSKRVQLLELGHKLILREWAVDLMLEEKGRELIFRGDLQRMGGNRFAWVDTHCILFDHYLVMAKPLMQKEGGSSGIKHERYDVSRVPIPMDLLVLDSTDDDPVVRGAASRFGIAAPAVAVVPQRPGGGRNNTGLGSPGLPHTNSSSSIATTATAPGRLVTTLSNPPERNDERTLYPFRIKHLGNASRFIKADDNVYTLYAPTAQNRQDWVNKIIYAKQKHAASLHAQNAEPFKVKVIADTAFGYELGHASGQRGVRIRGTPLDRAIVEVEKRFEKEEMLKRPQVVCRATVNCATTFVVASSGKEMVAVGTDSGVYVAEADNPRGWRKLDAVTVHRVTQFSVLEEFSILLILADKSLIAYHLDSILPSPSSPPTKRPPQKLSGSKDVGFFSAGRMKDRLLVFYKRRDNFSGNSHFKVLEPVFQKSSEKKSRFGRKGTTEYFREFDEFAIPTECFGLNLFASSFAIQTVKGIEVMTLDKKKGYSVPELSPSHVSGIRDRLIDQKPRGMFRLSDIEFLLCYEECGVYVNKHGDISRSVVMEFVGKAKAVALYAPYVLVFDQDFVEVRNAQNGRLRQVVSGKDVRCVDDGGGLPVGGGWGSGGGVGRGGKGRRTVKVAMQHPGAEGRQVVVELVLNEGHDTGE